MTTLILILQTYSGALAFEFGPYPDMDTCESYATKHIAELEATYNVLRSIADCRIMHPELDTTPALAEIED